MVRDDQAEAICDLALAMQTCVETLTFGGDAFQMRIGVASVPVTAGIIGRKKFSYDLWGDTVNLASRMESAGVPGRIQISDPTRVLVEDRFVCESRGLIEVRGKGEIGTWFLLGKSET